MSRTQNITLSPDHKNIFIQTDGHINQLCLKTQSFVKNFDKFCLGNDLLYITKDSKY